MTKEEFKILFDKYFDSVRSYLVYRGADTELATDIAQDVFLRIWEKQKDSAPDKIAGLLYKMAGDMFVSKYRRQKLEIDYVSSLKLNKEDISPEDQLLYEELKDHYAKALLKLSEKQRVVFLMSRLEGLKYHEIADRLKLSVKAVEKRMTITLSFLKQELQQQ